MKRRGHIKTTRDWNKILRGDVINSIELVSLHIDVSLYYVPHMCIFNVCGGACECSVQSGKRRKFTEHSDDGFPRLGLLRLPVHGALDAASEPVALYSQAHPYIKHRDGQHRHEEKYEAAELVKREFRHIRQQHCAHCWLFGVATWSCEQTHKKRMNIPRETRLVPL